MGVTWRLRPRGSNWLGKGARSPIQRLAGHWDSRQCPEGAVHLGTVPITGTCGWPECPQSCLAGGPCPGSLGTTAAAFHQWQILPRAQQGRLGLGQVPGAGVPVLRGLECGPEEASRRPEACCSATHPHHTEATRGLTRTQSHSDPCTWGLALSVRVTCTGSSEGRQPRHCPHRAHTPLLPDCQVPAQQRHGPPSGLHFLGKYSHWRLMGTRPGSCPWPGLWCERRVRCGPSLWPAGHLRHLTSSSRCPSLERPRCTISPCPLTGLFTKVFQVPKSHGHSIRPVWGCRGVGRTLGKIPDFFPKLLPLTYSRVCF